MVVHCTLPPLALTMARFVEHEVSGCACMQGEVGCVSQARESEVAVASVDETNLLRECVSELERALQLAQSRLDTAERQVQDLQAEVGPRMYAAQDGRSTATYRQ